VTGPVIAEYDPGIPEWVRRGGFHQRQRFPDGTPLHFARTSNVLVRLGAIETLGDQAFDLRYGATGGEDTHLFMRLAESGHSIVWADHALVSERVPVERAALRWMLSREYRRGCILSRCLRDVDRSALRMTRRVAAGASDMLSGCALLLTALVDGRAGLVRGARRICFGAGLVTGLSGADDGVETKPRVDA
jgi:succinoglycan biosynthesis protein ExoM